MIVIPNDSDPLPNFMVRVLKQYLRVGNKPGNGWKCDNQTHLRSCIEIQHPCHLNSTPSDHPRSAYSAPRRVQSPSPVFVGGMSSSNHVLMFNQLPPPKKKTSLQQLSGIESFNPSSIEHGENKTHKIDSLSQGYFFWCKSKQGGLRWSFGGNFDFRPCQGIESRITHGMGKCNLPVGCPPLQTKIYMYIYIYVKRMGGGRIAEETTPEKFSSPSFLPLTILPHHEVTPQFPTAPNKNVRECQWSFKKKQTKASRTSIPPKKKHLLMFVDSPSPFFSENKMLVKNCLPTCRESCHVSCNESSSWKMMDESDW